jgi:hypothetical protein
MGEATDHFAVGWKYENAPLRLLSTEAFLRLLSKELDRELDRSCLSENVSLLCNRVESSPWFIFLQFQEVKQEILEEVYAMVLGLR